MKKRYFPLLLLLLLFFSRSVLFAQDSGRWGDYLTVKLALIGAGDELHFWWGHVGLVIENRLTGRNLFYDWGVFSFDTENFFKDFAFGRPIFTTTYSSAELSYLAYIMANRDVILYTLNLTAGQKEAIVLFAENNVLPENADYEYHHFWDNCSTRIRDLIDMALDGQFYAKYGEAPGRFTLRQHVRRHTWFNPFFDWILNFWMGQVIDRQITVWDEMFLPSELAKRVYGFTFTDPYGNERPLVSSVEVVFQSSGRPEVLDTPRLQWPRQLLVSLLFSALFVFLFVKCGKGKYFKAFFGVLQSLLGLFFGIAGSVLFFLMFFTNHDYTFENINILFVNPFFLAAVPLGITFAFSKVKEKQKRAANILRIFWTYVFFSGLLTIVLRIFPAFYQQNQVTLAMILPLALSFVFALIYSRKNSE